MKTLRLIKAMVRLHHTLNQICEWNTASYDWLAGNEAMLEKLAADRLEHLTRGQVVSLHLYKERKYPCSYAHE